MKKSSKFSPEVRERAVRLVQEHRGEYPSLWAATESIAAKIGCVPQTSWNGSSKLRLMPVDGQASARQGPSASRIWERDVKELRRGNEILKLASAFFAQA
jgi:transposase